MGTLIDASVLIAAERGQLDLQAALETRSEAQFLIASITASELLHGLHRATTLEQRSRREVYIESLLARLPVAPFDLTAARVHARIGAELALRGVTIGAHELLIGATALAIDAAVATRNERSFGQIPGLSVERW